MLVLFILYKYAKKSRSVKKNKHNKTKRVSKRVLAMWADTESVWGKNKPLENWWGDLASGKKVVVIYMDGEHKSVKLNKRGTEKFKAQFDGFDADPTIIAVLSSNMSQDAYEENLYPKAKRLKMLLKIINIILHHLVQHQKI